jgi:hypothetical protein
MTLLDRKACSKADQVRKGVTEADWSHTLCYDHICTCSERILFYMTDLVSLVICDVHLFNLFSPSLSYLNLNSNMYLHLLIEIHPMVDSLVRFKLN